MLQVFTRDLSFLCEDQVTSNTQEKLRTGGGVCKNLSCQKTLVGDRGELEQLDDATGTGSTVRSRCGKRFEKKKKPFQKTLKFSDSRRIIRKQIQPSCRKIFRLQFLFVWFRGSNEI